VNRSELGWHVQQPVIVVHHDLLERVFLQLSSCRDVLSVEDFVLALTSCSYRNNQPGLIRIVFLFDVDSRLEVVGCKVLMQLID